MERRKFIGASAVGAAGLLLANSSQASASTSTSSGNNIIIDTTANAKALTNLKLDDSVTINDRDNGIFDVVNFGTNDINEFDVLAVNSNVNIVLKLRDGDTVNVKHMGAKGDDINDDSDAIQESIRKAIKKGRIVRIPAGTYRIKKTIVGKYNYLNGNFTNGVTIRGEGALKTKFKSKVTSGAIFEIGDVDGQLNGGLMAHGSELSGFSIIQSSTSTPDCAILMRNVSGTRLDNLFIQGIAGDGIRLENEADSTYGWNNVLLTNVHVEGCTGWGISAECADNRFEGGRLTLNHVTVNECGQASTFPPSSGGFKWKGFNMSVTNSSFYKNANVNIFIGNTIGLPRQVTLENLSLTDGTSKSIFCTGVQALKATNIQFSDGQSTTLESFIELDASNEVIRKVHFDNILVSADSVPANFTAFKLHGIYAERDTCGIDNVIYANDFETAGYTKTVGFKDKSTVIASKAAAQLVYPTESAVIWDTIESDEQSLISNASSVTLACQALYHFKGKVTLSGLSANTEVTIALKSTFPGLAQQQCKYVASGVSSQTFDFDFTGLLGDGQTDRDYQIMVHHNDNGSRSYDVSDPGYNRLTVTRLKA